MSKKRSWFCFIKKLFFQESHNQQQKCKRRRWVFGRVRRTARGLPSPPTEAVKTTQQFTETVKIKDSEEVKKPMTVCKNEVPKCRDIVKDEDNVFSYTAMIKIHVQHQAATKIQTAYRGHLARKALRALKGFVTLQAIIRGRAVRRQAVTTLKCLQSIVSIQSEICARRRQISQGYCRNLLCLDATNGKPKTMEIQLRRDRRSDCDLLTKDEEIDSILRKKQAILIKRQRIKAHSFNHRISTDSEEGNSDGRLKYWLKQYVNDQLDTNEVKIVGKQPKTRNIEGLHDYDSLSGPRRSLQNHKKQSFYKEDSLHPSSPTSLPTYMASTKSAKAKTRSLSSPRLRSIHFEGYSDGDSPYKQKLSPMSSINSEVTSSSFSKVSYKSCYSSSQQKSPSLKGVSGPVRSNRITGNVRLDVY
ncbi:hypothetical protein KSS87_001262 [Heliosperma pusillum]|nr:hypothetical protein KSS87_001262 [Heliosperma pusillum]